MFRTAARTAIRSREDDLKKRVGAAKSLPEATPATPPEDAPAPPTSQNAQNNSSDYAAPAYNQYGGGPASTSPQITPVAAPQPAPGPITPEFQPGDITADDIGAMFPDGGVNPQGAFDPGDPYSSIPPGEPAAGAAADDMAGLVDEAIRRMLEGQRDTTDEEAMINERIQRDMLGGLVDNQARAGAMGFGNSGALVGMDADIRGQAAAQAMQEIMGVRQDARDEMFRNNEAGIIADQRAREMASRDAMRQEYMDLIKSLDEGGGEPGQVSDSEAGYAPGDTIVDPDTGEKLVLTEEGWVPADERVDFGAALQGAYGQ